MGLPIIGLLLALFGAPLLLLICKKLAIDSLAPAIRIGLWLLCLGVVAIAAQGPESWMAQLHLHLPTARTLLEAVLGITAALAATPIIQLIQTLLGGTSLQRNAQFAKIRNLSAANRLFIAVTAGVVEEVLYRGYAIGIGGQIFGSLWLAASISLAVFVAAHIRWGLSHLLAVFWAGLVLSALFIFTRDLVACIIAHVAIDVIGILLAPAILAKREARNADANAD